MTADGNGAKTAREQLAELGAAGLSRAAVFPLSSAQRGLWLADQALPGQPAYHLVRLIELDGALDIAALSAAFTQLASRHAALRTSVLVIGGQPVQRVARPAAVELPVTDTTEDAAPELAAKAARRPLDVAGGLLWRAELHRLGPRRHRLVLVVHHLIADAATIALLLSDLAAAYRAGCAGEAGDLPPAVDYRDYVRWERSFAADPDYARQLAYWKGQLTGTGPAGLPPDRPRPTPPRRPADRTSLVIGARQADALRAVARAQQVTLAQLLLAVYAVVVHRYSGRDDFTIGTPVSLRRDPRWARSAGLYLATLPIRITITGNPPFTRLLRQVRGNVLGALGAADVPLERTAKSAGPLYDVTFGLVQDQVSGLDLPGLTTRIGRVYSGRAKFDLHFEVTDPGPGGDLDAILEYDAELFSRETARRLAVSLTAAVQAVTADPSQRIGSLPLWPGQLGSPAAGVAEPAGPRVEALFAEAARAGSDQVAVVDAADGSELTYAALAARAAAVAEVLTARGVRRGDFVGVALARSPGMVVALLGVLMAGAAYVPLDPGYPAAQLTAMISRSQVKLVVGDSLPGQRVPMIALPVGLAAAPAAAVAGGDGDPAYVMFTSGSSGEPKAVIVPHRAISRLVREASVATMTAAGRWLHAAAPAFDAATLELWAPLLNGGTVVVLPGLPGVARIGEAIRRHRVTSAFLTTGLFNLVVDTEVEALRPLRELLFGGEAASPGHMRRALTVVGTVVNAYGPTENTTFTTCHRLSDPAEVTTPVPLGQPIRGTSVHIVDDYGNPVPDGVAGQILAGGRGLAIGYAGAPGLTAERFTPSPCGPPGARLYSTGDYGRIGPGGVVEFLGRRDDQVKVRGFRIELGAIEQVLLTHPAVTDAVVTAHADLSGDRRLVGYVVGRADGPALSRHLSDVLPAYMVPTQWVSLPELPLGPTGKVDRRALPAPQASSRRSARPSSIIEELLVAWYAEFLGLADVTPETDFFAVGGHSLLASRLAARIRTVLAVDVPLAMVFSRPRLADLAAAVAGLERTDLPPLRPGAGQQRLPLSPAQERMWFLQRYSPASAQYHIPLAIDLTGDLDQAALAAAVQAVADRHPMLRATFSDRDGEPGQSILPAGTLVPVPVTDLTGLEPGLRQAALSQLQAAVFTEPFDLAAAPPLRAALVRTGARVHRLLLVVHHLVADGWSIPLIYRDLSAAYAGTPLPAQDLSYGDFAVWQRTALSGPAAGRLADYWRRQLAGAPAQLELDGDLAAPRGGAAETAGGICRLSVPAPVAARLREAARQAGATPFPVLLAAFAVLLSRHTPQRDLIIGTPVAGRGDAALADIVGLFLNTLPLRVDASGEPTFTELISQVRQTVVAGLEHAELPFERIVELADRPRVRGHQPLVQVLFALQPAPGGVFSLGQVSAEVRPAHQGTAKFDIAMSLFDDGVGFAGFLEYRAEVFSPAYATALAAEFTDLLASLTSDSGPRAGGTVLVPRPAPAASGRGVRPDPGTAGEGLAPAAAAGPLAAMGRLWEDLLGAPAEPDTNFFAAGGHSLAAMRMIAGLRDTLGRDVPLRDLFDHPTLAGFTAAAAAAPPVTARPALRSRPAAGPAPLSAEQDRHWVLYQLDPDSPAQNVPMVWRLRGPLDVTSLRRALTLIAVRQAVLRTTFEVIDHVPAQRVGPPAAVSLPVTEVTGATLDEALAREAEQPFDLTATPPWRARLLRAGADDHYLLLTLHHIICDGWSVPVLLEELSACYSGGAEAGLPPLPVQYADYAVWQRDQQRASVPAEYWAGQLAGLPDLDLPTDFPRPARPRHHSGEIEISLDRARRQRLESLATAEGATLFTALLAVFATALGRYSGQQDFAVGTFHANRNELATQRLIGYFVNNLTLRCDLSGQPSWRALIGRLRERVVGAYSHSDTPFELVIRDLRIARDARQTPLFQAMLVLQNLPATPTRIGPLELTVVRRPYERADFDLTLWLREDGGGGLAGGLVYDAEIFTAQTAARLAGLVGALLDACLAAPDGPLAAAARPPAVPLASATTAQEPPRPALAARFAAQAAATPDAAAVRWLDRQGRPADLTYAELAAATARLAATVRALGAGPESRIAVFLPRSPAAVTAFLAVAQCGAAYVPLDPGYPAGRIAGLLADAHASCVITTAALRGRLPATSAAILEVAAPPVPADRVLPVALPLAVTASAGPPPSPGSLAYVIFTSGSTGRPKPVEVSNGNLSAYLDSIMPALEIQAADRVLAFAATTFDATTEELYPALLSGACVVLRPEAVRVPDEAFDALLAATRPTVLSLPVTFWHAWADRLARENGRVPGHVRMLLLNAEEPSVRRYQQWRAAGGAGVRLVNTYGPTEATVTASLYEPSAEATAHELWGRFPIGTVLDGVAAHLLDPSGWPVPEGAVGELCLGGPAVTRGYGGQPGLTAASYWPDPWAAAPGGRLYRTGDLARRLADGALLLLGRADRQVKIRGHRVEPGEVEAVLLRQPAVAQAAVLTADDGELRQLVGYVATTDPQLTEETLRGFLAARLPRYMIPARLLVLADLPLTPNRKVDRLALAARLPRDLTAGRPGDGPAAEPPATAAQRRLHGIWCAVLGRPAVGVRENFFSLGGDSIRALQIVTQAREAGLGLTVGDLFDRQTIAELAELADTRAPAGAAGPPAGPPQAAPDAPATGLSDIQLRGALARLREG